MSYSIVPPDDLVAIIYLFYWWFLTVNIAVMIETNQWQFVLCLSQLSRPAGQGQRDSDGLAQRTTAGVAGAGDDRLSTGKLGSYLTYMVSVYT